MTTFAWFVTAFLVGAIAGPLLLTHGEDFVQDVVEHRFPTTATVLSFWIFILGVVMTGACLVGVIGASTLFFNGLLQ